MEIIVLDDTLHELGIADTFVSVIWTRRWFEPGSFEIQAPATANNLKLFRKFRYLYRTDTGDAAFIKSVIEDTGVDGEYITISGETPEGLLDKRATGYEINNEKLSELVKRTCVDGTEFGFAGFEFEDGDIDYTIGPYTQWSGKTVYVDNYAGTQVGEFVREVLTPDGYAVVASFDRSTKKITCKFAAGIDRSAAQAENTQIIFSEDSGNLEQTVYTFSECDCWTGAIIVPANIPEASDTVIISAEKFYSLRQEQPFFVPDTETERFIQGEDGSWTAAWTGITVNWTGIAPYDESYAPYDYTEANEIIKSYTLIRGGAENLGLSIYGGSVGAAMISCKTYERDDTGKIVYKKVTAPNDDEVPIPQLESVSVLDFKTTYEEMKTAAKEAANGFSECVEGTAASAANGYRTAWDVGDIVSVYDKRREIYYNKRVEEVTENYSRTAGTVEITFGSPPKTILDQIKEAKRK